MTNTMDALFLLLSEQAEENEEYRKKNSALSRACLAIVEELESQCGKELIPMLDAVSSLEAQKQEAHEQALFRAAVQFGMELGRMSVS